MTIRSMPPTDDYRSGWERAFGGKPRPPKPERCPDCRQTPCDPNFVHPLRGTHAPLVRFLPSSVVLGAPDEASEPPAERSNAE